MGDFELDGGVLDAEGLHSDLEIGVLEFDSILEFVDNFLGGKKEV